MGLRISILKIGNKKKCSGIYRVLEVLGFRLDITDIEKKHLIENLLKKI